MGQACPVCGCTGSLQNNETSSAGVIFINTPGDEGSVKFGTDRMMSPLANTAMASGVLQSSGSRIARGTAPAYTADRVACIDAHQQTLITRTQAGRCVMMTPLAKGGAWLNRIARIVACMVTFVERRAARRNYTDGL